MKNNTTNLKEALNQLIDTYKIRGKIDQSRLKENWPKVVGPMIAKHTLNMEIREEKLFIRIDSAPLRQELTYMKDQILGNVRELLGNDSIKEIVIG